jgi:hypothetical protein
MLLSSLRLKHELKEYKWKYIGDTSFDIKSVFFSGLLGVWILAIIQYSKEHSTSQTGFLSETLCLE